MSNFDVRSNLITAVFGMNLNYPIMYPNTGFKLREKAAKQPEKAPWIRATILNQDDESGTLGAGGKDRVSGIMQIDVFVPKQSSDANQLEIISELKQTFRRGATLSYGGNHVRILSAGIRAGTDEQAWYVQSLNVEFQSYLDRGQ